MSKCTHSTAELNLNSCILLFHYLLNLKFELNMLNSWCFITVFSCWNVTIEYCVMTLQDQKVIISKALHQNVFSCWCSGQINVSLWLYKGQAVFKTWWWWLWRILSRQQLHKLRLCFMKPGKPLTLWHEAVQCSSLSAEIQKYHIEATNVLCLNHTVSQALPPQRGKQRRGQTGAEAGRTVLRLSGKKVESEKYLNGQSGISK